MMLGYLNSLLAPEAEGGVDISGDNLLRSVKSDVDQPDGCRVLPIMFYQPLHASVVA
jgi:hypothetical protein